MMSLHLELLHEVHLEEVFYVFAYMKKHMNLEIVFDTKTPKVDMDIFQNQDCSFSVYSSTGEELKDKLPPNIPEPLGLTFFMRVYVDANHSSESVTIGSQSGYILFLTVHPSVGFQKSRRPVRKAPLELNFLQ